MLIDEVQVALAASLLGPEPNGLADTSQAQDNLTDLPGRRFQLV
jgi:hypothetical protein